MGEGGEGEWDGKEEDVRQRGRREGGAGCGGRRKGGGRRGGAGKERRREPRVGAKTAGSGDMKQLQYN